MIAGHSIREQSGTLETEELFIMHSNYYWRRGNPSAGKLYTLVRIAQALFPFP